MSHVEYTPVFASTNQPSFFPKAFKRINWLAGALCQKTSTNPLGLDFIEDAADDDELLLGLLLESFDELSG